MEHLKLEISQKTKNKSRPLSEARKIRKPLMERKRRERINTSLNELARLLVEAKKVDSEGGKAAKLEKADILELTVGHLQSIHNSEGSNKKESISSEAEEKYNQGFSECIKVVEKLLKKSTTNSIREKLLNHLNSKLKMLKSSQKVISQKNKCQNSPEERCLNKGLEKTGEEDISLENLTLVPTELPGGKVAFILKGDTKKLLKEWADFPKCSKFSSEEKENQIPEHMTALIHRTNHQKELDSSCRPNLFPTIERSCSPISGCQSDNICFQPTLIKMETKTVNPSCETKNNLFISVSRPSSPLNTSSNSTEEFSCLSLSKINTIVTDVDKEYCYLYPNVSSIPTNNLSNFSPEVQTQCLSDTYNLPNKSYVASTYSAQTNHANENSSLLIPSISHASINRSDRNQNSSNHVSNFNRNCSPSSSGSSLQRLPHKAHCPPTPPPSPPSGAEHRKSSKDCLINSENRLVHEAEIDIDQPFDLSMNKMWRPW